MNRNSLRGDANNDHDVTTITALARAVTPEQGKTE